MGLSAGLEVTSAELADMQGLSQLLMRNNVSAEELYAVQGGGSQHSTFPTEATGRMSATERLIGENTSPLPSSAEPPFPLPSPQASDKPISRHGSPGPSSLPRAPLPSIEHPTTETAMGAEDRIPVEAVNPPTDDGDFLRAAVPRPTTSGKSLELLNATGIIGKRKRVTLRLGKESIVESKDELGEGAVLPTGKPNRKRRRVVSTPRVPSSDEGEPASTQPTQPMPHNRNDGWEMTDAPRPCWLCVNSGTLCKTFVFRMKGQPRFACYRCHHLKKMCDTAALRCQRYITVCRRRNGAKIDDEESEWETGAEAVKPVRTRRKSARQSGVPTQSLQKGRSRKSKGTLVEDGSTEGEDKEEEDEDDDGAAIRRRRAKNGQGKRNDTVERSGSVQRETVKREEDERELNWMQGNSILLFRWSLINPL